MDQDYALLYKINAKTKKSNAISSSLIYYIVIKPQSYNSKLLIHLILHLISHLGLMPISSCN